MPQWMPGQPCPPWEAMARQLKLVRMSTLGGKANADRNEFESKSEFDELFDGFDVKGVGSAKQGVGTLTWKELKNGLIIELQFKTNLKNLDELAVGTTVEAMRRGYKAVQNYDPAGDSSLSKDEFRVLLIYLERFFKLLAFFKIVELQTDGTPTEIRIGNMEFGRAAGMLREWGLTIRNPTQEFKAMTEHTIPKGMMMFDEFAAWSLKESLNYIEAVQVQEQKDYAAAAEAAAAATALKVKKAKAEKARKAKIEEEKKAKLEKDLANVEAVGGAGQYLRPGSTLAITTSANVMSDYGIADISLYDLDGDGELDVGAEQDAARAAHVKANKDRMKAEAKALRKQNAELKKKRDHMRYVADAGTMMDEMDYMNDDDEDKDFWLARHAKWKDNKEKMKEENNIIAEENKLYRMRLKQTGKKVDTWTKESMAPIEKRLKEEREAAGMIEQIRNAIQGMLTSEPLSATSLALTTGATVGPGMSPDLVPLEPMLNKVNETLNSDFLLTFNEQHFVMKDRPQMPAHLLFSGGAPIKESAQHTSPDGTTIKYIQGKPAAVWKNGEPQTILSLESVLYD